MAEKLGSPLGSAGKARSSRFLEWIIAVIAIAALGGAACFVVPDLIGHWKAGPSTVDDAPAKGFVEPTTDPLFATFDLSNLLVPKDQLYGGAAADSIEALTDPPFVAVDMARFLRRDDRVIGVAVDGVARAYPLRIMNYHEVVNDEVGGRAVAVVYCPLCDSATGFERRIGGRTLEFGVSGMLYNNNVLLFDRDGERPSLWSQMLAKAVSGPHAGTPLKSVAVELTTWGDWSTRYPDCLVLAGTGEQGDYEAHPYADYFATDHLMFPLTVETPKSLGEKQPVLGVWSGSAARAYAVSHLVSAAKPQGRIVDHLDGRRIVIQFDSATKTLQVVEAEPGLQWAYAFWFAWHAFHPDTSVWQTD